MVRQAARGVQLRRAVLCDQPEFSVWSAARQPQDHVVGHRGGDFYKIAHPISGGLAMRRLLVLSVACVLALAGMPSAQGDALKTAADALGAANVKTLGF